MEAGRAEVVLPLSAPPPSPALLVEPGCSSTGDQSVAQDLFMSQKV